MTETDSGKKNLMTYAGLKSLEGELNNLKNVKRRENAQKIKEAREQGDLSENAEYDAAKEEQREIEMRIEEIEEILKNAQIIVEDDGDSKAINIGDRVRIRDIEMNEDIEYTIVGSTEADSLNNLISNESPLGTALLGARRNQIVTVHAPSGEIRYKVLKIEKNVV